MEEILDNSIKPDKVKVYRRKWILVGTFLGGPLASGYYFSQNFKAINQSEKVPSTWLFAIITTILVFGSVLFIPIFEQLPDVTIPIIYMAATYVLYNQYQEEKVEELAMDASIVHGWGSTLLAALIGFVVTLLAAAVLMLAYLQYEEMNTIAQTFGEEEHTIEYMRNNLSESEVAEVGQAFVEAGYFNGEEQYFLFLEKNKSTYLIYISVFADLRKDSETYLYFEELRDAIDDLLPFQKVIFKLSVDYYDEVRYTLE